jgi:hypothetical protein
MNQMDYELLRRARAEVERRFSLVEERPPERERPRHAKAVVSVAQPGFGTRIKRLVRAIPYARALRPGPLFDAEYYRTSNPDLPAGTNLLLHFITTGAFEGRKPHPLFDSAFYLKNNPDVAAAGVNPLGHYLQHGAKEGRQPHPLFDSAFYWRRYEDVREAGINPLLHYVTSGAIEGRKPHPLFQPDYYFSQCPETPRKDPLVQFLEGEHRFNPHLLFDCESYLREHPDAVANGINPLVHYVLNPARRKTDQVSQFEVQDVQVRLIFAEGGSFAGDAAVVWKDDCHRTRILAPPQQQPFFLAISYDQLYAQVDRHDI